MAYFGGSVSQRAFPVIDLRFIVLFCLASGGVLGSIFMGRELLTSDHTAQATESSKQAPVVDPQSVTPKKIPVYIASEAIPAGKKLSPGMFRLDYQLLEGLEDRVVGNLAEFEGQYARVAIAADAPLLKESVTQQASNSTIVSQIPQGYRAVAIPVNALTGVEGWVQPGVRVDVVWSTVERGHPIVTTLVENAQVLSAERSLEPLVNDTGKTVAVPSHISLLVTTKDAQKIQLAKNSGSLSLSLRGQEDVQAAGSDTLRADSLLRGRSDEAPGIQGSVTFNGQEYVLRSGALVPKREYESDEQSRRNW